MEFKLDKEDLRRQIHEARLQADIRKSPLLLPAQREEARTRLLFLIAIGMEWLLLEE